MSITTYTELQASVANWLNRSDLSAQIPDFITIAESNLSADLNSRSMETKTNLATVAGISTVALPSNMVEMHRLQIISSTNTVLAYRSADEIAADYNANTTGSPAVFTVIGGNIELAPIPDAIYTLELVYKQRIPALSAINPTNWLLTAWPDCYLFGALVAARAYINDPQTMQVIEHLYAKAASNVNSVDWYSGSTMRVRAR